MGIEKAGGLRRGVSVEEHPSLCHRSGLEQCGQRKTGGCMEEQLSSEKYHTPCHFAEVVTYANVYTQLSSVTGYLPHRSFHYFAWM
jgi:hypothetical protein